jgi:cytochrome b involved in lipid metabolism
MAIRLEAVRTFEKNLKDWCRGTVPLTVPLLCVARYLSNRPVDWLLFLIGWKFLRSSTTYFFGKNDDDHEKVNFDGHRIHRGKTNNNNDEIGANNRKRYRIHLKSFAETRAVSTAGAAGVSHLLLTSLPSVVLSNVACYLHPRDVLDLDTVLRSGMGLGDNSNTIDNGSCGRNGRTTAMPTITRRRLYDDSVGHDIWKQLWYRDYGDVLLRWKVSREAFLRSLMMRSQLPHISDYTDDNNDDNGSNINIDSHNHSDADGRLEVMLSKRLDEMVGMPMSMTMRTTMKDFYFLFGECYIDFVLARKNTVDECYLGLHGHVFDFTDFAEFHPGLIEPILKECGGDATYYFEDIPHSSAARNIARRLCVLVDHSVIDYDNNDDSDDDNSNSTSRCCGLELVLDDDESSSKLKDLLRSSNTRPLNTVAKHNNKNHRRWMAHIVPRRHEWRKHPTVERIRMRFEQEQRQHEKQQGFFQIRNNISSNSSNNNRGGSQSGSNSSLVTMTTELISSCSPFRSQQDSMSRCYYDPLGQEWVRWCPENTASTSLTQ